jgi:transcription antitermination factor NusA-like protein
MIYKSAKVGEINDVTVIEFGTGDVAIGACKDKNGMCALTFMQTEKGKVGSTHRDKGKNINEVGLDVLFTFMNIESLEVVEDMLSKVKVLLKNELNTTDK